MVSQDRRTCLSVVCSGREIVEEDGSCRQCLEYTKPDFGRRNCVSDVCDGNYRVSRDGTCELCPAGTRLSQDKRFCDVIDAPPPPPVRPPPALPNTGRRKDVALLSVSPLDRLLNQIDADDNIMVQVGCSGDVTYE